MNMSKQILPQFEAFLSSSYGVILEDSPFDGELARGMVKETKMLIVREHAFRREADCIEIFLSDKDMLKALEEEFHYWCAVQAGVDPADLMGGEQE
jgi:hypothetical protein